MTAIALPKMTVAQLVERFTALALAQNHALFEDEIAKFNQLFDQMSAVTEELKSRPGDQRLALLDLFNHVNIHVRLKAAKATMAVSPARARKTLEEIAASKEYPQAGDAGMSLINLDRGIWEPS